MVLPAYEWTKVQYTPPLAYEKHTISIQRINIWNRKLIRVLQIVMINIIL